eukprot:s2738_g2.t1
MTMAMMLMVLLLMMKKKMMTMMPLLVKTNKMMVAVVLVVVVDTLAFRLHGPKPQAVVIHPVLTAGAAGWGKPWQQILWDAEEALGLARANRWDLLPGPNGEPSGGWDHEAFAAAEAEDLLRRQASGAWSAPEGWHLDRGEEET